jgi:hypothetical protein
VIKTRLQHSSLPLSLPLSRHPMGVLVAEVAIHRPRRTVELELVLELEVMGVLAVEVVEVAAALTKRPLSLMMPHHHQNRSCRVLSQRGSRHSSSTSTQWP